jgi:electron transfer flavoprotein beta subunit
VGQAGAGVKRVDYFVSPAGVGAEILQGTTAEIAAKLLDLLKTKGGLK